MICMGRIGNWRIEMRLIGNVKRSGAALGLILNLIGAPLSAETLAIPTGEAILTVSGQVAVTNLNGAAVLDRAMLEALAPTTYTTTTIWTEGEVEFTGAPLAEVLRRLGIESGTLRATAVNDYAVAIPVEDALGHEKKISAMINNLMSVASDEDDYSTRTFLH